MLFHHPLLASSSWCSPSRSEQPPLTSTRTPADAKIGPPLPPPLSMATRLTKLRLPYPLLRRTSLQARTRGPPPSLRAYMAAPLRSPLAFTPAPRRSPPRSPGRPPRRRGSSMTPRTTSSPAGTTISSAPGSSSTMSFPLRHPLAVLPFLTTSATPTSKRLARSMMPGPPAPFTNGLSSTASSTPSRPLVTSLSIL